MSMGCTIGTRLPPRPTFFMALEAVPWRPNAEAQHRVVSNRVDATFIVRHRFTVRFSNSIPFVWLIGSSRPARAVSTDGRAALSRPLSRVLVARSRDLLPANFFKQKRHSQSSDVCPSIHPSCRLPSITLCTPTSNCKQHVTSRTRLFFSRSRQASWQSFLSPLWNFKKDACVLLVNKIESYLLATTTNTNARDRVLTHQKGASHYQ